MTSKPLSQLLDEAFVQCRDMDASLAERLQAFADAVRRFGPNFQDAVDGLVNRLKQFDVGDNAPKPGEVMPNFVLPDENGQLVSLDSLLQKGPVAVTFHRGHWCPYCRINTRTLAEAEERLRAGGAQIVAITPERQQFAAKFKADATLRCPVLTDTDNGYALSLGLAIWVGDELEALMAAAGRNLPIYQGNEAWFLPIPATFVVTEDGTIAARFIDPDYRKRMGVEDLFKALKAARNSEKRRRWP
jgi:peroxiredoxin